MIPACDRQTVRQTDVFIIAISTALCIASYADALERTAEAYVDF